MRVGLDAVRARRRLAEYRRLADEATSSYLAERDRAENGGVTPKAGSRSPRASNSPVQRRIILISAVVSLAVVELTAASTGVSEFNGGAQSRVPPALTHLTEAAVVSTSAVPNARGGALGGSPTTPPLITTGPTLPAPGASQAASAGPVPTTGPGTVPTVPGSSPSTGTSTAGASPYILGLCQTVVATGNGWPSVLKGADRAAVIAAAGKKNDVLAYCTNLVATSGN